MNTLRHRAIVFASVITLGIGLSHAGAENPHNIMLTGYWPPTNDMLRKFSTNPKQNPDGWEGEDWEGRGYDIYAFFPEFPDGTWPIGEGDFEVDYQDTSEDWWPITAEVRPVAIITFSRGSSDMSWEIEMNQFNRLNWIADFERPFFPTPSPPDDSVPAETLRPSSLPVEDIAFRVNLLHLGLTAFVCYDHDGGGFLSEFIAYHGVWYRDIHLEPEDEFQCVTAGHIHVGEFVSPRVGTLAAEETLRVVIGQINELLGGLPGDGDSDGDVDLFDFAAFTTCVTGPGGLADTDCGIFNFDDDLDVDWTDFGAFQLAFTGAP